VDTVREPLLVLDGDFCVLTVSAPTILMLKARTVTSEETRQHLHDAHQRVMALAAVQGHLHGSERHDLIEIGPYLSRLCESLAASMIHDRRPISLQVLVNGGTAESAKAVSLGLPAHLEAREAAGDLPSIRALASSCRYVPATVQHWAPGNGPRIPAFAVISL
jgi:Histidine kinase